MRKKLIKILAELEPTFMQAGRLAVEMQKTAKHHNKLSTGISAVDIVTEADLAVQEFLLLAMAQTELINCRLLGEENTPLVSKFTGTNGHYLTIDPIDGTAAYANGGKAFSVIISLHDGKNFLYTFKYFPVYDWGHRIIEKTYSVIGTQPTFLSNTIDKKSILYYTGNPKKNLKNLYDNLVDQGLNFINCLGKLDAMDASSMFNTKLVAGVYYEDPNVYDGVVALHIAIATNRKIYFSDSGGILDLNNIQKRESGFYYPGYYLTLN